MTIYHACILFYSIALFHPVVSWVPSSSVSVVGGSASTSRSTSATPVSLLAAKTTNEEETTVVTSVSTDEINDIFEDFVNFLQDKQTEIIETVERMDGSGSKFTTDKWGLFDNTNHNATSGGITRVIQGGNVVEKGACSLTLIRRGVLSAERAAAIRSRQDDDSPIRAGDAYSAAALSIVFHTRSPLIPTFRSDVRIFLVESNNSKERIAFFGGGADLTPYYLFDEDITFFHTVYRDLCQDSQTKHPNDAALFSYPSLKRLCDDYFYLPARSEHRGTGGIFFDDLPAFAPGVVDFVRNVANAWMPSWLPIVTKRRETAFTDKQKQWQLLRRGRYLEFNLLYDRGVKFGLAMANPRVEGVMVSAPPVIAFEYNHKIEPDSDEDRMMQVLKIPREWV
ncbi:coproporphyrinogen III oxidase [Nitzschia inconspicua]|uniref:Coproporphyrinogen III oxidase n=1 Tax=Nitzschia inconspicua TaxID=303405 RepID=A0A9K3KGP8_9STRA|nr:coproporphyrinogen III oxidase [Nitzschia inconspicua]